MRKHDIWLLTWVVSCFAMACPARATETPNLEAVRRAQDEWSAKFASIRVQWRQWHRPSVMQYFSDTPADATLETSHRFGLHEFCWSDIGALTHESRSYRNGQLRSRNLVGIDGEQGWDADAKREGEFSEWEYLKILGVDSRRPLRLNYTLPALFGLWNSGEWMSETLHSAETVRIVGEESLAGHQCVVVEITEQDERTSGTITYWIDMAIGGLPRRYRADHSANGVAWTTTWSVDDFQEVKPGMWFPQRGFFGGTSIEEPGFEWIIESVELNPAVPASHFRPPISKGTKVIDYTGRRAFRAGTEGNLLSPVASSGRSGEPEIVSGDGVRAEPPASQWWRYALLCTVMLGILVVLRRRQRASGAVG